MEFKLFVEQSETYMKDVRKTLKKLPVAHRKLVRGYSYHFQGTNTLKGDGDHIGYVDETKKKIMLAAPWNYGREFTMLHEVGHAVWKYLVTEKMREKWKALVDKTKKSQAAKSKPGSASALNQGYEELFCMSYAAAYCKQPPAIFNVKEWIAFITKLPQ
jgi:hypothetical protein